MENDTACTTPTVSTSNSQVIINQTYSFIIGLFEFVILIIRITLEIFVSTIKLLIGEEQKDVSGEIVLITGTGHGIGRELALQYTELGCTVICVDINEAGNEATVKEANGLEKGKAISYLCDVSDRQQVLNLAKKIKNDIGCISLLVNNVGIMPTHPIEKHTPEEIRKLFDINILSQFWTLEAFLPHMKEKCRGHIVAISSIAGVVGLSNLVPYCATKFAVRGMMEALSEEIRESNLKNLIKTTTIYPYMVNTGLCKKPRVRFPMILGLLDPKKVAASIIKAQRMNMKEATVPRGLWHFNNFCRLLPINCGLLLKDFIDSGVDSDIDA